MYINIQMLFLFFFSSFLAIYTHNWREIIQNIEVILLYTKNQYVSLNIETT